MLPLKNKAVGLILLLLAFIIVVACQPGPNQVPASPSAAVVQRFPALELTLTEPATPVSPSPQFELMGALGGTMRTAFAQGQYVYAGVGLQLVSLDMSDPTNPKSVGSLLLPQGLVDIYADGVTAYVAHTGGVSVINIADPTAPVRAGLFATPGPAVRVTGAAGVDHLYVAYHRGYDTGGQNLGGGLMVLDISNPTNPVEVGNYQTPATIHDMGMASTGGRLYAYLAEEGECQRANSSWVDFICQGQVRILDLSKPDHPLELTVYKTTIPVQKVAVNDGRAYLAQCGPAQGCEGLVLDVSDSVQPRELNSYSPSGGDVVVAGDYLYSDGHILDISDPLSPREIGSYQFAASGFGLAEMVVGDYLYTIDPWQGLRIVDVSNPTAPAELGFYDPPGPITVGAVKRAGNYLYVTDDLRRGLVVIDVSNPAMPQEAGFVAAEPPGQIWDIHPPYLYLGDEWQGLHLVDISTPTAPAVAGFYPPPLGQRLLAVADGYAYITTPTGWQIVDLTDPAAPRELGQYQPAGQGGWPLGATAQAGTFYTVAYEEGWQVIDWGNPTAPVELGFAALPAGPPPLIANQFAYAAAPDGMQIYDLSHPAAPARTGFYQAPGGLQKVAAVNAGLAMVVVDLKAHLVDVSNPAAPVEVGIYDGLQPVETAALAPGPAGQLYAYLYSPAGRLDVVDVSNPANPIRLGSRTLSPNQLLSVSDILVAGRYAYLYDRLAGHPTVVMVDIANPAGPFEAGAYQAAGQVRAVRAGSGGVQVYVIDADYNLRVVDLSDPAAPQEFNVYDAPENIVGLSAGETVLYLTLEAGLGQQAIQRLDVSHPAAPQALGRYESGLLGSWLMVIGDHLYLQTGRQMIRVVDVSDPARPVEVGASPLPAATGIEQFFGAAGRVYLVVQQAGGPNSDPFWELQVVDVSDPAAPAVGGAIAPAVPALDRVLAAAGGNLYFVDRQGQLRLADVSNPAAPRDVGAALNFGPAGYIEAAELAGDEIYLGLNELGLAIFRQP